jgi:hypothetical protein
MAQADLSGSQLGVYQVEALIGAGASYSRTRLPTTRSGWPASSAKRVRSRR